MRALCSSIYSEWNVQDYMRRGDAKDDAKAMDRSTSRRHYVDECDGETQIVNWIDVVAYVMPRNRSG